MRSVRHWAAKAIIVLAVWATASAARAEAFDQGLLWRVEPPDAPASYVFGTVHSEDPRVIDLPAPVREAFDGARRVTLEMVPDTRAKAAVASAMYMTDGHDLAELVGQPLFDRTASLLADYGVPEPMVHYLKPWAAFMILSMPKPETGQFLDVKLYQRALRQDKAIDELETPAEQLAIFEGIPRQDQIALLRSTVEHHSAIPKMLDELHQAYLERDLAGMRSLNERYMRENDAAFMQRFSQRLIRERNRRMLDRIEPRLAEGDAFIAVGALHLPGEGGLLQGLAARGYEVTVVY